MKKTMLIGLCGNSQARVHIQLKWDTVHSEDYKRIGLMEFGEIFRGYQQPKGFSYSG